MDKSSYPWELFQVIKGAVTEVECSVVMLTRNTDAFVDGRDELLYTLRVVIGEAIYATTETVPGNMVAAGYWVYGAPEVWGRLCRSALARLREAGALPEGLPLPARLA